MLNLLIVGILFILLGIFTILSVKYEIKLVEGKREIIKKDKIEKSIFHRYKIIIGIFAVVLGVFSILNYIIF